jgi:hypothetical protein
MTAHSIEGYLSAVKIRERPTLLVEGKNDKKAMDRLYQALGGSEGDPLGFLVIDSTELIKNRGGLGARELVEAAYRAARSEDLAFAALVDREYRAFEFSPDMIDGLGRHYREEESLFWTRGHSIENYFFTEASISEFMSLQFPHVFSLACKAAVSRALPTIVNWCCAVSLAARELAFISRCQGIAEPAHWRGPDPAVSYDVATFCASANARGANVAPQAASALVRSYLAIVGRADPSTKRWVTHGHIGFEMLWAGIARIVEPWCQSSEDRDQIAFGFGDLKIRVAAQEWVRGVEEGQEEPPSELIEWLKGHQQAA